MNGFNIIFLDNSPAEGVNYYRLKQIDFDGRFEWSDIESVAFSSNTTIKNRNTLPPIQRLILLTFLSQLLM